jgi:hypothetical protein
LQLMPVGLGQFAKRVLVPGASQRERAFGHVRILTWRSPFGAITRIDVAGRANSSLNFATSRRLQR